MTTLFGIHNCDSVKKARQWLDQHQINYQFHDFRKDGLSESQVKQWLTNLGWEKLINKRSTSWRELDASTKENIDDEIAARLILQQPTLIKRPLLSTPSVIHLGFKNTEYQKIFAN